MAVRQCPYCMAKVPATHVVARSNDLVCPGCQRPLEISPVSQSLAVSAGLISSAFIAGVTMDVGRMHANATLIWALPAVYAVVIFGGVTPLMLMLTADLRLKSLESPLSSDSLEAPAERSGGHTDHP